MDSLQHTTSASIPDSPVTNHSGRRTSGRIRTQILSNTVSIYKQPKSLPSKQKRKLKEEADANQDLKRRKLISESTLAFQSVLNKWTTEKAQAQQAFLKKHDALFFKLLPSSSHASFRKLIDASSARASIAFETLEQPETVHGQMKSYQLTGLSFLVWLHRNGMNGILGDANF